MLSKGVSPSYGCSITELTYSANFADDTQNFICSELGDVWNNSTMQSIGLNFSHFHVEELPLALYSWPLDAPPPTPGRIRDSWLVGSAERGGHAKLNILVGWLVVFFQVTSPYKGTGLSCFVPCAKLGWVGSSSVVQASLAVVAGELIRFRAEILVSPLGQQNQSHRIQEF